MTPIRLWAAVPLLALAAGLASAATHGPVFKKGGIFRVGMTGASVQIDPQLSYVSTGWWLEYATAAKLYNYPDKRGEAGTLLRPEAAAGFTASRDGRTYTFTIRKGFRFSDGSPVTARNFAYAIERAQNQALGSPAEFYIHGARAKVRGSRLVVHLARPEPSLLAILAMPFFQATLTTLPLDREVTGPYPSAGPYYFARNDVNSRTSIRRNPYWKPGPGRERPRRLTGVEIEWNLDEQSAFHRSGLDGLDQVPIPAAEVQHVADRFGVNRSRFWAMPTSCLSFIVFNNRSGIFAGNPALRRAVNWALDRTDYFGGTNYSIRPWTHILPPVAPGSVTVKNRQPYGARANLEKARKIASGHFRDGKIVIAYRSSGTLNPAQAQSVRRDLLSLGFSADKIQMKGFSGARIYEVMANPQGLDLFVSMAWCDDNPPSASFLASVLPLFGYHNQKYEERLAAIARLPERARNRALGRLDLEIMREAAPVAPMGVYNKLYLFSNRVNPSSLVYQPAYTDWSIPALALK
jgi:peptide/nickel transport system substrate-binding protein